MRTTGNIVVFLLGCAVSSAGGWWLARSSPWLEAGKAGAAGRSAAVPGGSLQATDERGGRLPLSRRDVVRKMAAQADTARLWRWYLSESHDYEKDFQILAELADRLGWAAWDQALALEDPALRSRATEGVLAELAELAKRDPWRAYETWRDHWQEFGEKNSNWGGPAMHNALENIGQAPAAQMIAMMKGLEILNWRDEMIRPEYRADFDFAAVANFLNQPGPRRKMTPVNLLEEWARISPAAFSRWLLEHAEVPASGEPWQCQDQADRALRLLALRSADTPGRAEALEILGGLPEPYLKDTWRSLVPETIGTLSLPALEAATQMNQREAYLWGAISTVSDSAEIDPSWAQLPVADRQPLLEKMEKARDRDGGPGPLQKLAWEHWLKRLKAVWGME